MKILLVAWNFPPRLGGAEKMVYELFENLAKEQDVTLLTGAGPVPPDAGGTVRRALLPGFSGFLLWLLWALPRELARGGYEVLFTVNALVGSLLRISAKLSGLPHAVLVFGSDLTYRNPLYQRFLRRSLPAVDRLLAISRPMADLAAELGVSRTKIALLPPGIDPSYAELPARHQLPASSGPALLFVGRIIPRKGLGEFLDRCLPLVLAREAVEVWVVGGEARHSLAHGGGELARIGRWLRARPYAEHVRFLGEVDDEVLRAAYRRARVLILPALARPGDVEGFGIVFLEAAMFGVPAVSTRVGGIVDAVVDGDTGFLVEAEDWEGFAERLVRLVRDDELHRAIGRRAQRRALEEYSWPRLAARCADQLAGILRR